MSPSDQCPISDIIKDNWDVYAAPACVLGGGCAARQEEERSGAGWRRVESGSGLE